MNRAGGTRRVSYRLAGFMPAVAEVPSGMRDGSGSPRWDPAAVRELVCGHDGGEVLTRAHKTIDVPLHGCSGVRPLKSWFGLWKGFNVLSVGIFI